MIAFNVIIICNVFNFEISKLVLQKVFVPNQRNDKLTDYDFQSLNFLIIFDIYQELMFKELLNLKKDVNNAVNNFETLVLEFKCFCDDIF